jgi:hypothetical protein
MSVAFDSRKKEACDYHFALIIRRKAEYVLSGTDMFISYENHDRKITEYSHIPSLAFQTLARSTVDIIGDRMYEETKRTYKLEAS